MNLLIHRFAVLCLVVQALTTLSTGLNAQSIYGTLTGIVSDPSGAVLPDAKLQMRDEQSGSQRETVANGEGYFSFVSLPPGKYQLTVSVNGFDTLKQTGISVLGGD